MVDDHRDPAGGLSVRDFLLQNAADCNVLVTAASPTHPEHVFAAYGDRFLDSNTAGRVVGPEGVPLELADFACIQRIALRRA